MKICTDNNNNNNNRLQGAQCQQAEYEVLAVARWGAMGYEQYNISEQIGFGVRFKSQM